MSAVPRTPVARPEIAATAGIARRRPAWLELATSGDHKAVGVLYVAAALGFLALALTELVLMRVQLIVPESTLIGPEIFDQLLSAYGSTAIVLFGIPLALGLMSFIVPLQIGARAMAFPRLNALSWWLYLTGGVTIYVSFLYAPSQAGTIPFPPLASDVFSASSGVDAWIAGTGLAITGFVLFAVNLVATLRRNRAPGMAWRRVPLFSWAAAASSHMLLVIGPVMIAALAMLLIDRQFDGVFYNPGEGGAPILFQHLSWIFFTGAYFLVLLAATGAISEIVQTFARRPLPSHRAVAASFVAIAVLGPLAWMQNMYSAPIPIGFAYFAMAISLALVVPIGLILVNWLVTLWRGELNVRTPMLFALGAISTMTIGLAGELGQSLIPVGWQLGSSAAAWGDTHYALIGGAVFGGFAGLYYWFPKLTGRSMGDGLGRASFWTMLVGVHVMVIPLILAGLDGQVVDIYKFYGDIGLDGFNLIGSIGAFVLAVGIVLSLVNAATSARGGRAEGHDPWGGSTLEWFTLSPPPPHNFDLVPDVRSATPLHDIRDAIRRRSDAGHRPSADGGPAAAPPSAGDSHSEAPVA
jgi:cytochrome c oxidase subunit 1